jgi:phenylalanyl-tRNA synthetase beta chain
MIRETLGGAGLTEVVTHALVAPDAEPSLRWPDDTGLPGVAVPEQGTTITVTNPLSSQHSVLRRHLIGSLLDVLALNERQGREDVAVFEVGKGYGRVGDEPVEWTRLGMLLAGAADPPSWNRAARHHDLDDAKGLIELVARRLGLPAPAYAPDTRGYPLHPGRALVTTASNENETLAGRVAELHPDVLEQRDFRALRVIVAELAIGGLEAGSLARIHVEPIGRFPEVERDLAVIVGDAVPSSAVAATIASHAGELLRSLRLFDLYRGSPLAASEKSLAYRLVFGARDRTLTEAEVDEAVTRVEAGLKSALGAHLRT